MTDVAALVVPAARWHDEYRYELAERAATEAFTLGCRGVLLGGGPLAETQELLTRLRARSRHAMIAVAELGGGVGERFPGATALPPLAALDAGDLDSIRRAARLTAREARAAGINWALGPSGIDPTAARPIERARTFSGGDDAIGDACAEWIDACQAESVVATPGPYPLMRATCADAALDSGAGAMQVASAHAIDRATMAYLRNSARFDGVVVARLDVVSELHGEDEDVAAVACVAAGCDLLLGADDAPAVVQALRLAQSRGSLREEEVVAAVARVERRATWAAMTGATTVREPTLDDALWARRAADAAVHVQRGRALALSTPVDLIVVDDDPPRVEPSGTALLETLLALGVEARRRKEPDGASRGSVVVALIGDRRISLGFDTFSDAAIARVREIAERAARAARDCIVVHFTPPDFAEALDGVGRVACAWSGSRAMEEAAARWLARGGG